MGITSLLPKWLLISNKAEQNALSLYVGSNITHLIGKMVNNLSILDFKFRFIARICNFDNSDRNSIIKKSPPKDGD